MASQRQKLLVVVFDVNNMPRFAIFNVQAITEYANIPAYEEIPENGVADIFVAQGVEKSGISYRDR